jgi:hypothetical protein
MTMKSDRDDPRNAIAVSGDDGTGDGGAGWVSGCAAMIALIVGASAMIVEVVRWIA